MRIAMMIPIMPPEFSGAGERGWRMARGFASRGLEVHVLTYTASPTSSDHERLVPHVIRPWRETLQSANRNLVRPMKVASAAVISTLGIARYLRRHGIDLVHHMGCDIGPQLAGLAAVIAGVPYIAESTLMGSDDAGSVRSARVGKLRFALLRRSAMLVNVSPRLQTAAIKAGLPSGGTCVIPNDVDIDTFCPARTSEKIELRRVLGLPTAGPLIVTIGAVIARKGMLELTRAFVDDVLPSRPDATLAIVGPIVDRPEHRAYLDAMRALCSNPPASNSVVLVGKTASAAPYLRAADAFAFASREEGFGTVVAEALAVGLPIVARNIEGISRFILDEAPGTEVVSHDEHLGPAMLRSLDHAGDLQVQRTLRQRAVGMFSEDVIFETYIELFRRTVTEG